MSSSTPTDTTSDTQVQLHNLLCDWSEADGFGRASAYFAGFVPQRCKDRAGRCVYTRYPDGMSKVCRIEMAPWMADAPTWFQRGVLWHEWAHAYTYLYGAPTGHGKSWLAKYIRRPGYVLANFCLAFWYALKVA